LYTIHSSLLLELHQLGGIERYLTTGSVTIFENESTSYQPRSKDPGLYSYHCLVGLIQHFLLAGCRAAHDQNGRLNPGVRFDMADIVFGRTA
jgi:hypothetical protein